MLLTHSRNASLAVKQKKRPKQIDSRKIKYLKQSIWI